MRDDFGRLLRKIRKGAGLTMEDLADELGVSITYISDVERGHRPPFTRDKIFKAAALLDANPALLLVAAAKVKGAFELSADGISAVGHEAGAYLARQWSSLTDDDFADMLVWLEKKRRRKEEDA